MNDIETNAASPIEHAPPPVYAEDMPAPPANPLLMIHRIMRGRYLYAILLAALLAPVGAVVGYMAMPGKFISVAQIRVPASSDPILYSVTENQGFGLAGYERAVGNEVEQMLRPERMRDAALLLNRYVNIYNEGAQLPRPDYTPQDRDWTIDEAREAAAQLIRIAADESAFRALDEDWALRTAAGAENRGETLIESVAPSRLLTPVGLPLPEREEIATLSPSELIIDPRTARRVIQEFSDIFQNPTASRPPRGQEPPIVWESGPGSSERLAGMVSISPPRKSEQISVTVQTDDPRLATLAANAVIVTHRLSTRYADAGKRLRDLRAREAQLDSELRTFRRDVLALRSGYSVAQAVAPARSQGAEVPLSQDPRYIDRLRSGLREGPDGNRPAGLQRIRTSVPPDSLLAEGYTVLTTLQNELTTIEGRITELELATAINSSTDDDALERADSTLRSLRDEQRRLELQIERSERDFGPNHPSLRSLRGALEIARNRAEERIVELRQQVDSTREAASEAGEDSAEVLERELALLVSRRDEKRRDIALVNDWIRVIPDSLLDLIEHENRVSRTSRLLDDVRRAREELETEMVNLEEGRFQYFAAQVPQNPSADKRLPLAAAGFMAGGGFGVLLVAAFGFLDRRYRYIEEVESNHKLPPVIGVLPMLSSKRKDAEQSEVASLTVHHIRNVLLLEPPGPSRRNTSDRSRVITITSAGPGDGKTSVVVALGMSFAQAGYRTLVVDADLVGKGLSAHFDVRCKPGLAESLMGHTGEPIEDQAIPTEVAGLSILSSGNNESFRPEHMARERFSEVLAHYRNRFDIVLIDSGPLLGSLEAGLATRSADRVVVVVSRGSEQRSVSAVVKRLRDAGLRRVSLVFNKALPEDIEQSVTYISMRSQSIRAADQSGPNRRTVALANSLMPAQSNTEAEEAVR